MSSVDNVQPDPSVISDILKPPFVQLPDPARVFAKRAERLRALAEGHQLAGYLRFLADLTDAQVRILQDLPEPQMPPADAVARAKEHAMPPLDRNKFSSDKAFDATLERLISEAAGIKMPDAAQGALDQLRKADNAAREIMIRNVLADSIPVEELAAHVLMASALQVHFARLAQRLDKDGLVPVGDGACPACGAPPAASAVVGWPAAPGARYCSCSLCGTLWNYVRSRCTICGSTEKIAFQEVEGTGGEIKAETCGSCNSYVKVVYQQKNAALDPVADDVASLGLDLLVRELGFRRGGFNPFLLGY
jgi:FdhE protein